MSVKSVNLPSKFLLNIIDARLTATETRLLLCIAFYTFGINSEFCPLSYGFLSQAANIDESDTKKLIRNLEKRQIIKNYKIPGNKNKNLWGIDKSFYLSEYKELKSCEPWAELEKLHQCNNGNENPGEPRAAEPSAEDPGRTQGKKTKKA